MCLLCLCSRNYFSRFVVFNIAVIHSRNRVRAFVRRVFQASNRGNGMRRSKTKLTKNLGMVLLGIWLIVTGLLQVTSIPIQGLGTIMAILAIAAGILILLGR